MKNIKAENSNNQNKKAVQKAVNPVTEILGKNPPEIQRVIKEIIAKAVEETFPAEKLDKNAVKIEHPNVKDYGDYSTNIALILSGRLKLRPMDVAEKLSRKIEEYIRSGQTISLKADSKDKNEVVVQVSDVLENVTKELPGFVNLFLSKKWIISQMEGVLKSDWISNPAQSILLALKNTKTVIEYTDPNPFKEFHIGHLISNVTGESLSHIREAAGAVVYRTDYFGDVGVHAAKSIWGIMKKMEEENVSLSDLSKKSLAERINFMGQGYAAGTRAYEDNEKAKDEIGRLNTVLYIASQRMWKDDGKKTVINYDPEGKIKKEEIQAIYDLYKTGRKWSLEYFETIYKVLGTKFDGYYPESIVGEVGYKLVRDNIGRVFEESDGAVVFKGGKFGLHTRVFINKHNLPTYEAKELGLAPSKYADFPYDESIIVVGKEIKEYFNVLVTALKQVNKDLGEKTFPICTGMVKLTTGKMSSRSGNVVTVTGILDNLGELIKKRMTNEVQDDNNEEIAQKVAVAALKYAFLKNSIGQDFVFDAEKALSLEGDSGPYLLYTYARCRSVQRKFKAQNPNDKSNFKFQNSKFNLNPEELELVKIFYKFEEVAWQAARDLSPNVICTYLYDTAAKYNLFYQKHSILKNPKSKIQITNEVSNFRLALTQATAGVLKRGLNLLGIETVERM